MMIRMVRTIKDTIFHCPYPILMREVEIEITKHYYKDVYFQYKEDSLRSRKELYEAHPFMMCLKYGYSNKIFTEFNISKPLLASEIVSFMKKHASYILDRMNIDHINMFDMDVMDAIRLNMAKIGRIFRNEKIRIVGIDKDYTHFFKELLKDVYAHTRKNLKRALSAIYKDAIDLANSPEYNIDNIHKIQDIECYYFGISNTYKEVSHLDDTIRSLSLRSYDTKFDYYTACNEFMDYIAKSIMKVTDFLQVIVNLYFYDGLLDCIIADFFSGRMQPFKPITYSAFLEFMTGKYISAIAATTDTNKKILYVYNSSSRSPYAIYDDEYCKFSVVDFDKFRNRYYKFKHRIDKICAGYTDIYKKIMFIIEKNETVHFIKKDFLNALSAVCIDRSNRYKSLLLRFFDGHGFTGKGMIQSRFATTIANRNNVLNDMMSMLLKIMQKRAKLNKNSNHSKLYEWRLNINDSLQVKVHVLHSDLSTIDMYNYRNMVDKDGRICFRMKIGIIFHLIDRVATSTKPLYTIDSYFYVTVKMSDSIKNTEVILHVDDLRATVDDPYEMDLDSDCDKDIPWMFDYSCDDDETDNMTFNPQPKYNGYTAYYTNNAVTRYLTTENILNMIAYDSNFQEALTESYKEFLSGFYDKMYYLVLAVDHLYGLNHESSKGDVPIEIAYNGSIRDLIMESSYYYADGQTFGPKVSRLFDYHHMDGSIQFGDELNGAKEKKNSGS